MNNYSRNNRSGYVIFRFEIIVFCCPVSRIATPDKDNARSVERLKKFYRPYMSALRRSMHSNHHIADLIDRLLPTDKTG